MFLPNKGMRGAQMAENGHDIAHRAWYYLWDKLFPGFSRPESIYWHDHSSTGHGPEGDVVLFQNSGIPQLQLRMILQRFQLVVSEDQSNEIIHALLQSYSQFILQNEEQQPRVAGHAGGGAFGGFDPAGGLVEGGQGNFDLGADLWQVVNNDLGLGGFVEGGDGDIGLGGFVEGGDGDLGLGGFVEG